MVAIGATPAGNRVLLLGPLAIESDSGVGALRGQQGKLLGLLAAAYPNPVSSEVLIDELWPDQPPKSARTGLRVMLTRLRERLDPDEDRLVHSAGSYRLTLTEEQFDHRLFEQAVTAAQDALHAAPQKAADFLVDALGLWRGSAYQPFESSPRLNVEAAHLEERRREAEELLLDALLRAGRADSAATWASSFVETEPFRERRWEHLILALYRTGRQAEALRAAHRVGSLLREELGIEAGPQLQQLEADVLAQSADLDGPPNDSDAGQAEPLLAAASAARNGGLPTTETSFVGRGAEERKLNELIERSRLVTIVGPPGGGKTRLAAQYGAGTADRKLVWLDLVPLTAESLVEELANALGLRLANRPALHTVAEYLGREPGLLVLDNCEHLIESAADLAETLLATCPGLHILATSRVPLSSPSEARMLLEPLDLDEAIRLLSERCSTDVVSGIDRETLEALVDQLDRLPLSIELVAPVLESTLSGPLLQQLASSLDMAAGRGRSDPRHRSLKAAINWSVDLLDDEARTLFLQAGVLHGNFTTRDVVDLTATSSHSPSPENVEVALSRLSANGLLQPASTVEGQPGWYQLNVLRTHARSQLDANNSLAELERTHAELHIGLVQRLSSDLVGPAEDIAVARLRRSTDQLRATHQWLVANGEVERSAAFSLGVWEYSFFRQQYNLFHWLDDTLGLEGVHELEEFDELLGHASLAAWAGDRFVDSISLADRAESVALAARRPVPLAVLKARFNVASHQNWTVASQEIRATAAIEHLGNLLKESALRAEERYHADNLVVSAIGMAQFGLIDAALDAANQAKSLAAGTANPTSISWARVGLGSAQLYSDPLEAARSFSGAGRLARTVDNRWVDGMAKSGLVTALRRQGRERQAQMLLVEVVELWGRAHSVGQLGRACQEAVMLLAANDNQEAAARLLIHLELSDHGYPVAPADHDRFETVCDQLRQLEVTVDVDGRADHPSKMATVLLQELRG